MTNSLALFLGGAILAVLAADQVYDWGLLVAVGVALFDLVRWLSFWN